MYLGPPPLFSGWAGSTETPQELLKTYYTPARHGFTFLPLSSTPPTWESLCFVTVRTPSIVKFLSNRHPALSLTCHDCMQLPSVGSYSLNSLPEAAESFFFFFLRIPLSALQFISYGRREGYSLCSKDSQRNHKDKAGLNSTIEKTPAHTARSIYKCRTDRGTRRGINESRPIDPRNGRR